MQITDTNPLSIFAALVIGLVGLCVFAHDSQIDNVVMVALSTPSIIDNDYHSPVKLAFKVQHVHSDSGLLSGNINELRPQEAATQPFNKQDKKYIAKRRLTGNTFGNEYIWPSI